MNIWNLYKGERFIKPLNAMVWRVAVVGDKHCLRALVDTAQEHVILDEMVMKASLKKEISHEIFSSFYCDALKGGCRFSKMVEPSLWYGSLTQQGAFEEASYYLKQFYQDTTATFGLTEIMLSTYQSVVSTPEGVDLTASPFDLYQDKISSKETYTYSQSLGQALRKSGVCAALYYSARTTALTKNIVVFSEAAWSGEHEQYVFNQQFWSCIGGVACVEVKCLGF